MTALALLGSALASPDGACEGCHQREHAAWATSRHAAAYTNAVFQASWDRTRDPWCTSCHAPEGGVGCLSCHDRPGGVASAWPPSELATAVHAVVVVPDLGTTACAGCHQFEAPGGGEPVQKTGSEHADWSGRESCASCHGGGHGVPSSRDPARLRQALSASVERQADGSLRIGLVARGIGHRFPTGDPWRRLVFQLLDGESVTAEWTLARRVSGIGAAFREVSDGRLPFPDVDGVAQRVLVAEPELTAQRWRLSYAMVDPSHRELDPSEVGFVVAEGPIRP